MEGPSELRLPLRIYNVQQSCQLLAGKLYKQVKGIYFSNAHPNYLNAVPRLTFPTNGKTRYHVPPPLGFFVNWITIYLNCGYLTLRTGW
jgi:hypothetical protein